jgi:mannose-6-phosphate isomerase-like protein (cupin superfamily)
MTDHTLLNLRADVPDAAAAHDLAGIEARFASVPLGLEHGGVSLQRLDAGVRQPFGHRHREQEELYVVVEGGGRVRLDAEVVALRTWDALRVPGPVTRCFEAGPDGMTYVVFGAPRTGPPPGDGQIVPDFWPR